MNDEDTEKRLENEGSGDTQTGSSISDTSSEEANTSQVDELFVVEAAIRERLRRRDELKNELKVQNEMLKSYLENDEAYREATKAAKDASAKKTSIKQSLLKSPAAAGLPEKVQSLKDEQGELNDSLSYYLREYNRLTGLSEFEDEDGEVQQIVYVAKLVKRQVFQK